MFLSALNSCIVLSCFNTNRDQTVHPVLLEIHNACIII